MSRLRVRRRLMADKSLSTSVHNVQGHRRWGYRHPKGVVASSREQEIVPAKAVSVAGQGKAVNQLEVAPK